MSDFAYQLKTRLEADPNLSRRGARVLEIINGRRSGRRTRLLVRMERHAAAVVGKDAGAINWATIDWKKLMLDILAVLLKLLPLIFASEE